MKAHFSVLGAAALLAVSSAVAFPQQLQVDGTRLRPGTDSLGIYLVHGDDTTRTGTLYDELTVEQRAGRPVIQRVYRSADQVLGVRLDSLIDDLATLAPVSHRSRSDRNQEFYGFKDGRAVGWVRLANSDSLPVDAPVTEGTYNASSVDLVLRAAALNDEWATVILAFLPSTRTVVPLPARVTGSESISGEEAWRIVVDFGGLPVTFWVGKESRRLLQQLMQMRPDVGVLFAQPVITVTKARAG